MLSTDQVRDLDTARLCDLLRADLDRWRGLAAAGQDFEFHRTQIETIARLLEAWMTGPPALSWSQAHAAWILWQAYRDRLTQRNVPGQRVYLRVLDTLADRLYRDVQAALQKTARTMPLVSFQPSGSPSAQARGEAFAPPGDAGPNVYTQALRHLAVPLVGFPLAQGTHLALLPTLAHEVGHLVYDEFGFRKVLEPAVQAALGGVTPWTDWLEETFCDVYAGLALGPSFALALAATLGPGPDASIRTYPSRRVRMTIQRCLAERGDYDGLFPLALVPGDAPGEAHPAAVDDIADVVDAILAAPLQPGGPSLSALRPAWTAADTVEAQAVAARLSAGVNLVRPCDVRHAVAGPPLWWWGGLGWAPGDAPAWIAGIDASQDYTVRAIKAAPKDTDVTAALDTLRQLFS